MSKTNWNVNHIPDLNGKVIIVTGATSGLGKEATKILTQKDATVIMAVRNAQKAETVVKEIKKQHSNAQIDIREMDLSSLASVKLFANGVLENYDRLDAQNKSTIKDQLDTGRARACMD